MEVEILCVQLSNIYDLFYGKVYESVKENFNSFTCDLREQGLITRTDKLTYNEIVRQVFAGFQLSSDVQELEKECQKFLSSLVKVGNHSATMSKEIRKRWNLKAVEMNICADFLSVETCK